MAELWLQVTERSQRDIGRLAKMFDGKPDAFYIPSQGDRKSEVAEIAIESAMARGLRPVGPPEFVNGKKKTLNLRVSVDYKSRYEPREIAALLHQSVAWYFEGYDNNFAPIDYWEELVTPQYRRRLNAYAFSIRRHPGNVRMEFAKRELRESLRWLQDHGKLERWTLPVDRELADLHAQVRHLASERGRKADEVIHAVRDSMFRRWEYGAIPEIPKSTEGKRDPFTVPLPVT